MSSEGRHDGGTARTPTLRCDGVTKRYGDGFRLRGPASGAVTVLDGVDLVAAPGEVIGVVGPNGAGKSTLLRVVAGITETTAGSVVVDGTVTAMIELGLSFHPELTGRENLPLTAALLGGDRASFALVEEDVIEFSGLRDHLDRPLKHYSTGMVARLAFAVATHVPARLLLVDEILAVGDRSFQAQCLERVRRLAAGGTTVLFVSHAMDLVCQVCSRAVHLAGGRVVDDGPADEVVARYVGGVLRPPPRPDGSARLRSLELPAAAIASGEYLEPIVDVDVLRADAQLAVQSEFVVPPQSTGPRAVDVTEPGAFTAAGTWRLGGRLGPIPTTAGRLHLVVDLTSVDANGEAVTVDRRWVPFDVVGDDVGAVRVAIAGRWDALERDGVAEPTTATPRAVEDPVVDVRALTKVFRRAPGVHDAADGPGYDDVRHDDEPTGGLPHPAVDAVTFSVGRGESVGLIGPNGAGKSTLLSLLAGVRRPSGGSSRLAGRTAAVLQLGAGLHGDLSVDENAEFMWRLHGGTADDWARARGEVMEFAGLTDGRRAAKHLSTGQSARLAVSIAVGLAPDVLLVDEALAVGDLEFRERVRARLADLTAAGTTLLFATHDHQLLNSICDRVLRLDEGRLVDDGPARSVLAESGGAGWAGGTQVVEGPVVLRDLRVRPGSGDDPSCEADLEIVVHRPAPSVELEFSIRRHLEADERAAGWDDLRVAAATMCVEAVDVAGGLVRRPGRYRLRGRWEHLPARNLQDVVVTAVDRLDGTVVSEQWVPVDFGFSDLGQFGLDGAWRVLGRPSGG